MATPLKPDPTQLDVFFEKLAAFKGQFEIEPVDDELRSKEDGACPILMVAGHPTSENGDAPEFAKELGLNSDTTQAIIEAADLPSWLGTPEHGVLRRRMLETAGLAEPGEEQI
jgi:hypothetical protein